MNALCCALLALSLLCWPTRAGLGRLAPPRRLVWHGPWTSPSALDGSASSVLARADGVGRGWFVATGLAGGVIGWLVAGPGGALGLTVLAGTAAARWRARRSDARRTAACTELAAALGLLTAELRAGVHPAIAAGRIADDAGSAVAGVFAAIAGSARLSGDVPTTVRRLATTLPALTEPLGRLAAAWELAQRHGIGLADVLDAVRCDLDHRVRAQRRLGALLAGPRATSVVLALLPVVGLLLGQAIGAAPLRVFTGGALGQLLLVSGCGLVCLGLAWNARLVAKVAAP